MQTEKLEVEEIEEEEASLLDIAFDQALQVYIRTENPVITMLTPLYFTGDMNSPPAPPTSPPPPDSPTSTNSWPDNPAPETSTPPAISTTASDTNPKPNPNHATRLEDENLYCYEQLTTFCDQCNFSTNQNAVFKFHNTFCKQAKNLEINLESFYLNWNKVLENTDSRTEFKAKFFSFEFIFNDPNKGSQSNRFQICDSKRGDMNMSSWKGFSFIFPAELCLKICGTLLIVINSMQFDYNATYGSLS